MDVASTNDSIKMGRVQVTLRMSCLAAYRQQKYITSTLQFIDSCMRGAHTAATNRQEGNVQ